MPVFSWNPADNGTRKGGGSFAAVKTVRWTVFSPWESPLFSERTPQGCGRRKAARCDCAAALILCQVASQRIHSKYQPERLIQYRISGVFAPQAVTMPGRLGQHQQAVIWQAVRPVSFPAPSVLRLRVFRLYFDCPAPVSSVSYCSPPLRHHYMSKGTCYISYYQI